MRILLIIINALVVVGALGRFLQTENYMLLMPVVNSGVTLLALCVVRRPGYDYFTLVFNLVFALLCLMMYGAAAAVQLGIEDVAVNLQVLIGVPLVTVLLPVINAVFIKVRLLPAAGDGAESRG